MERVAGHAHKHLYVVLLLNLRVQLVDNLVEIVLHLGVFSEEMLRVDWLGHVLLRPFSRFVCQLFEFMLLQAGLYIKIIGNLFFQIFVFLKETFGVFAVLQLFYLNN